MNLIQYFKENKLLLLIIIGLSLTLTFITFSPAIANIFTEIGENITESIMKLIELIKNALPS